MAGARDLFFGALLPLILSWPVSGCSSSTVVSGNGASGGAAGASGGAGGSGAGSPAACPGELVQLDGSPLVGTAHGDLYNLPTLAAGSCVADQNDKQTAIYHFVAPRTGVVTLEAKSTSFGPAVYIWKGCADPYSEIGCWEQGKGEDNPADRSVSRTPPTHGQVSGFPGEIIRCGVSLPTHGSSAVIMQCFRNISARSHCLPARSLC